MKVLDAVKGGIRITHGYKKLVLILLCFNLFFEVLLCIPVLKLPKENLGIMLLTLIISIIMLMILLIVILLGIFIGGGIRGSIKDILIEKRLLGNRFIKYGKKYFWRLLGFGLLMSVVIGLLTIPMMCVFIFIVRQQGWSAISSATWIVAGALVGLTLIFTIFTSYGPTIIVLEDTKVFKAFKGSFKFVKRYFKKVLGLYVISFALSAVGIGLSRAVKDFKETKIAIHAITRVIIACWNSYIGIILPAAFMVLYLALMRKPNLEKE